MLAVVVDTISRSSVTSVMKTEVGGRLRSRSRMVEGNIPSAISRFVDGFDGSLGMACDAL